MYEGEFDYTCNNLGGDKEHIQAVKRLVDIADAVRLHEGVLLPCCHQLWEGSDESLRNKGEVHKGCLGQLLLQTSILDFVSSTNCLEMIALPVLLQTAAAISTMASPLQPALNNVKTLWPKAEVHHRRRKLTTL